jgi:predicted ATPase
LKFFPLLQQSIGTTVNGLFLWDGQYVDFKDFDNTVKDGKGEITVEYFIDRLPVVNPFGRKDNHIDNVSVRMVLAKKDEYYDYLKTLFIHYDQVDISIEYDADAPVCRMNVNGIDSSNFKKETIEVGREANLLPTLRFIFRGDSYGIEGSASPSASSEIRKFLRKDKNDFIGLFEIESDRTLRLNRDSIHEHFKKQKNDADNEALEKVTNIQLYYLAGRVIQSVNSYFTDISRNFSYVLPLRSIMNRYYRFQNRDVDQIAPDGDNLAMFLNSLTKSKFEEFNKWLSSIFHFKLHLQKSEGHVEILIEEEGKNNRNLVDVGFGYTQILPIITIIWKAIYGKKKNMQDESNKVPITIAIEQPELHLHPRFQAHFAQMLAAVMGFCHKHKLILRIIIETHSEVIVNKLGQLIESSSSDLRSDDVNVVLFNAKNEGMNSYVHSSEFSNDGYLKEWPFGFFSEDVY